MDPETEKIIKTQIEKLPNEIRNLFTDPGLGEKILNIARKNGITNIEELGTFQTETNLVMLGLVHPDDYPKELKDRLKIDETKVNNIVNDVNIQILTGIREKLKEIYEKPEEDIDEPEEEISLESREKMLEEIENPDLSKQKELPAGNMVPPAKGDLGGLNSPRVPLGAETPSILSQKLSGSFQIPKVETDHTISNMTKGPGETKEKLPKIDPYRESIE